MEKLKSLVPETLKQMIAESTTDDLPSSCSSLLDFLLHFEPFQRMVNDLTDPEVALCGKNKEGALESKQKGNRCFLSGDYANALNFYTQALRVAPMDAYEQDRKLVATLYVNRASVLHKMGLVGECVRDCNRALRISSNYAKAWFRRGKANASMGKYEDAIRDLDVAKTAESSVGGKKQIESEMKIVLDQQYKAASPSTRHNQNNSNMLDEPHQMKLQCVTTPEKGKGLASTVDIPQASLVHTEDPFATIILKHCRETHCHYCLNELPADKVPCTSCSIPWYCSQKCCIEAGGEMCCDYPNNQSIHKYLPDNLQKYIVEATLIADSERDDQISEHKHECKGVPWPAVLPSEIVLAGRVLVNSIIKRGGSTDSINLGEISDLSHHYSKMPPESKLELHIFSAVLSCCLQHCNGFEIPINGISISQIVILISQIRVNSMTVVRMKFIDQHELVDQFGNLSSWEGGPTSNVEQVRVGQAIYASGSLFNHSCRPNIHAYFLSRTLHIRTTEYVSAGCPLELSYGPQVGQWDCKDRIKFLEDEYSFRCQCTGCSKMNFSDLVLNAFHCVKLNCSGIVLESSVINCEKEKLKHLPNIINTDSIVSLLQAEELNIDDINKAANDMQINSFYQLNPGYCLKCGSYRDLESSSVAANNCIRRLQNSIDSKNVSSTTLLGALSSLGVLRSTLHAYNRRIAEAEDNLAQAFCLVGELQPAMEHCKASIEILEKLYNLNHIVIGYELVKLSSIQLSLRDSGAVDSIDRLYQIFSCYYGSHTDVIFPDLQFLRKEGKTYFAKYQLT
ncbi:putative chromatin remodeling SET family [Rosa chinensis]|uniref:Putative chromatin remodeling SET family n=2 Tax=Rosa chinensis TaxID=74649 RepID=A0A2P6SLZ5_ROSCH|nr:SET and MYND domain-containing protein 4 isoform X1 [Rosa chinensis]PRQ59689.1 putative chromatin remodeling SET family [Rosa chinensis]